ncbi:DUF6468 domain-containing protein [Woodsholea maritima]|uniref:DUF6468 domain-containing protein n=1 Tax=Woodsholea maritima TaxID=240237 RepID=UPI0003717AE3|nr:DUF6468 domain-containing protein [Woodsholea maritima]
MSFAMLIFEGLIALLLISAIVMCWRVDRQLKALRSGQDGIKQTVEDLDAAVDRARASLAALDRAAKTQGQSLQDEVARAKALSEELAFLSDGAERRAERLSQPRRPDRPAPKDLDFKERAEGDEASARLLDALKAMR